MHLKVVCIPQW